MNKKVRQIANVLLGATSLMLVGCHVKKAVEPQVMPLYGVPMEYYENLEKVEQKADSTNKANEQQAEVETAPDTTAMPAPGIMVKYGVPRPL